MSVKLQVDLDSRAFDGLLDRILEKTSDLTPALKLAGSIAIRHMTTRFRQQGPGWAPLSARTLRRRRKLGRDAKILQDTGRLRNSLVSNGEGAVYQLGPTDLVMGTNLVYAATHQFGRGAIPARPFLPEPEPLMAEIRTKLERYIDEILNA